MPSADLEQRLLHAKRNARERVHIGINSTSPSSSNNMATSMANSKAQTNVFTIDLLWTVISRSIFHPFVTWLIPMCQRAAGWPKGHPHVLYAMIWAAIVSVVSLFFLIDQSLADGYPRDCDWEKEVIVVTGGSNGLGKLIVEMFAMRGNTVAVLDIQMPTEKEINDSDALNRDNVHWYKCDVSKFDEVKAVNEQIERDLGKVTVLINNAAIVHGLPILSLTASQVAATLNVNLLGHFNTLQTFLPSMLAAENGGTIVTVASVLGKLGAAQLADYTASKAGLIALHASVAAELRTTYADKGGKKVRHVLVNTGQLATDLFHGMQTPSSFFGPVVDPVIVAKEVVRYVDMGLDGEISFPLYAQQIAWMDMLPPGLRLFARWMSGIDKSVAKMQQRRVESTKETEKKSA
ncbi:hypothetical protein AMS68_003239 [Peltaster fructicola]|uniref:Uncharacterized protein n=1 Tax=Peltaster fructicola TaxID=286661 RepID=A0A6H0XSH6_9PEZI|nr:hypothetical protein AMS68_003239 [Peltaster fructicola]